MTKPPRVERFLFDMLVGCCVIAGAALALFIRDYTSRPPEPVTNAPDASYEQRIAMTCEGIFVATEQGGCDEIEIVCQYPDGTLVSGTASCPAR